jgi:hypothetical protein
MEKLMHKLIGVLNWTLLRLVSKSNLLRRGVNFILNKLSLELTSHGIKKSFRYWTIDEIQCQLGVCNNLINLLTERGLSSFVCYGTLLGFIRNNSLLDHDDDIDMVCIFPKYDARNSYERVDYLCEILTKHGYSVGNKFRNHIHVSYKGSIVFDVFTAFQNDNFIEFSPSKSFSISQNLIYPLQKKSIYGLQINIPFNSGEFLSKMYGESWSKSDVAFSWGKDMTPPENW